MQKILAGRGGGPHDMAQIAQWLIRPWLVYRWDVLTFYFLSYWSYSQICLGFCIRVWCPTPASCLSTYFV